MKLPNCYRGTRDHCTDAQAAGWQIVAIQAETPRISQAKTASSSHRCSGPGCRPREHALGEDAPAKCRRVNRVGIAIRDDINLFRLSTSARHGFSRCQLDPATVWELDVSLDKSSASFNDIFAASRKARRQMRGSRHFKPPVSNHPSNTTAAMPCSFCDTTAVFPALHRGVSGSIRIRRLHFTDLRGTFRLAAALPALNEGAPFARRVAKRPAKVRRLISGGEHADANTDPSHIHDAG